MIDKIYAFGTSHTAGGGFEFNTTDDKPNPNIYKKFIDSENHFDYSFPSILSRMIDIPVENHAKQGYGWERVTRKIFEVISREDFKSDSSLFLIECSSFDRQEFWNNLINDYVIVNSHPNEMHEVETISIANDYFYQSNEMSDMIHGLKPDFSKFLHTTSNVDKLIEKLQINFLFLISFLEKNNIRYYLTNGDIPLPPQLQKFTNHHNKILSYQLYDFKKKEQRTVENWVEEASFFEITITHESTQKVKDNHQGYSVSEFIAETIYNRMINDTLISGQLKEIDFVKKWNDIKNRLRSVL